MTMIYTNDGMIGLRFKDKVIWCSSREEAIRIMFAHFAKMEVSLSEIEKDVSYAINHMARTGDTIAEFGVFGGFMYTRNEPEYEF